MRHGDRRGPGAFLHLDTAMKTGDRNAFSVYPYLLAVSPRCDHEP
jgi:hypothetical protein